MATLEAEFEDAERQSVEAQNLYESGRSTLSIARRLVSSFGGETERWSASVQKYTEEKACLVGDVLLASSFVTYAGPFSQDFRTALVKEHWLPLMATCVNSGPLPMSAAAHPLKALTNEALVAKWHAQGLGTDHTSLENAAIVENCRRWPLMIDPHLQVRRRNVYCTSILSGAATLGARLRWLAS